MIGTVSRSPELLRFFNNLAHEALEVELDDEEHGSTKRKKIPKIFAPFGETIAAIKKSNPGNEELAERHLAALIRARALKMGLALKCTECLITSWFSLEDLSPKMPCPRCLSEFNFLRSSSRQEGLGLSCDWSVRNIRLCTGLLLRGGGTSVSGRQDRIQGELGTKLLDDQRRQAGVRSLFRNVHHTGSNEPYLDAVPRSWGVQII
jgi:hypothetical protein